MQLIQLSEKQTSAFGDVWTQLQPGGRYRYRIGNRNWSTETYESPGAAYYNAQRDYWHDEIDGMALSS